MSDNLPFTTDGAKKVATDEATYSGDTAHIQLARLVHVTGSEGSKTVAELIKGEDDASASGDPGVPVLAVRKATPGDTSGADGDYETLQVKDGRLWATAKVDNGAGAAAVNVQDGGNSLTVDGTVTAAVATGATDLGKAEDAAHTTGDVGVMLLGVRAAAPTDRSAGPTDGDYEPIGINDKGAAWVSQAPSANGGADTINSTSSDGGTALTNSAQAIKASAGTLCGYYIYNPNTAAVFVCVYNTASGSVTVGTTAPLFMLTIPALSAVNLWMTGGIQFSTAISWAAASTAGGNGAPTTALDAVAWYK